ncbi:MAG: hypothetical protein QGG42_04960 [Phycisphaerae bacterium]|jgi:hypothetical protein|nr:hypothetical protein [Phycisphaerae bacterium]
MMAESTETYRRMPSTLVGTLLRWFDRSTAWLGDDHVLLASRMLWFERYNRFYFADIQAITICRTQTGLVWNILLGVGTGLIAFGGMLNDFPLVSLIWLGIFALPLIMNVIQGPTCSCHIYTAVSARKLACFNRLDKAALFLQTVRPLVTAVQGEVSDEEIIEQAPLMPVTTRTQPGDLPAGPKRHYNGRVHNILFIVLLLVAIVFGLQMLREFEAIGWLIAILLALQFAMAISAAAKQSGTNIPNGLRTVVWLAFGQVLLTTVLFVIAGVVGLEESVRYRFEEIMTEDPSTPSTASMLRFFIYLFSMVCSLALFFVGRHLLTAFQERRRLRRMATTVQARAVERPEV